jgi:hypothetical protein
MAKMTDLEASALDERWTENAPEVGADGTGFFARRRVAHLIEVDEFTSNYLATKATAENKTPKQIVREIITGQLGATG